jgi:hypothetical protein
MNNGPILSGNDQVGKGPPYGSDSKTAENHAANLLEKLIRMAASIEPIYSNKSPRALQGVTLRGHGLYNIKKTKLRVLTGVY